MKWTDYFLSAWNLDLHLWRKWPLLVSECVCVSRWGGWCGVGRGLKADGVTSFSLLCHDRLEKPELPYATHTYLTTHTRLMTHCHSMTTTAAAYRHSCHKCKSPSQFHSENVHVFQQYSVWHASQWNVTHTQW